MIGNELRDGSRLPADFNREFLGPRILHVASPTCSVCLDGIDLVREGLEYSGPVRLHVVWIPVLEAGGAEAASSTVTRLSDIDPVVPYWDTDHQISEALHGVLGLERWDRSTAWDLCAVYDTDARWGPAPPAPSFLMQQLRIEDVPAFESQLFREALDSVRARSSRLAETHFAARCRREPWSEPIAS